MGGGQVIVSGKWNTLAGGTTAASAIIAAATVPAGVTIWDNRTGASFLVQSAQIAIPNASVLTLNSVGYPLIAAPAAGSFIQVIDMMVEAIFATAAFTGGGAIQANYGTGTSAAATATIASTFLTTFSATQMIKVAGALAVLPKSTVVGAALRLACASGDFVNAASGASTLLVTVNYKIVSGL